MACMGVLFLLLACLLTPGFPQRTYMRSCDCEYTVDGKCAYTLLLPAASDNTAQCTSESGDVSAFEERLSTTESDTGEHGTAIVRLSNQIEGLSDRLEDNDCSSCQTCDPCQLMEQLDGVAARNTDVENQLGELDDAVAQIHDDIGMFRNDVGQQVSQIQNKCNCCSSKGVLVSGSKAYIPDSSITATSALNDTYTSNYSRILRTTSSDDPGAWCPVEPNGEEYLQFDLGESSRVYGVVTKGRSDYEQWVTSYSVQYKVDDEATWTDFTNVLGEPEIFVGNSDQNTGKVNIFWQQINTRYLRIFPLSGYLNKNKCMRADVIGCLDDFRS